MSLANKVTPLFNLHTFRVAYYIAAAALLAPRAIQAWLNRDSGVFWGTAFFPDSPTLHGNFFFFLSLVIFTLSLFAAALDFGGRWARVLSLVAYFNLYYPMDSLFKPYDTNIVFFNLLALCFFPRGRPKSTDTSLVQEWPLALIKLLLDGPFTNGKSQSQISSSDWTQHAHLHLFYYEH